MKPLRYVGHIGDMDVTKVSIAGVWPAIGEVMAAANYYFNEARIHTIQDPTQILQTIEIRTVCDGDVRGNIQRTSGCRS